MVAARAEGLEPPGLLIRRCRQIVPNRRLLSVRWADIPQLSSRDRQLFSGLAAVLAAVTGGTATVGGLAAVVTQSNGQRPRR